MSWVRPGVLLIRAKPFWLVKVFSALDLPAFERPAKATSIPESLGKRRISGALKVKVALLKWIFVEDKSLTR